MNCRSQLLTTVETPSAESEGDLLGDAGTTHLGLRRFISTTAVTC